MHLLRSFLIRVVLPIASICVAAPAFGLAVHPLRSGPADRPTTLAQPGFQIRKAAARPSFVVTSAEDDTSGVPANCTSAAAKCSLRDALAASVAGGGTITFAPAAFASPTTITLGSGGSLTLPSNTSVNGLTSGSGYTLTNLVKIKGSNLYDIFVVKNGTTAAALANVILDNYPLDPIHVTASFSALVNDGGSVSLVDSTVTNAYGRAGKGAVFNGAGGSLIVSGCAFIFDQGPIVNAGTAQVINSTFGFNGSIGVYGTANGVSNTGVLTLTNDTFIDRNVAITTTSAIAATNTLGDCTGTGCPVDRQNGNLSNYEYPSDLSFGAYGGPTRSAPLPPGSPGICEGVPTTLKTDQRGFARSTTYGSTVCYDSGAAQGHYALVFSTEPQASVPAATNFPVALEVQESGLPISPGVATATVPLALGAGDNGTLNLTSLYFGYMHMAATPQLTVSLPGSGDTLFSSFPLTEQNPPSGVPNVSLAAVSTSFDVTAATSPVTVTISAPPGDPVAPSETFSVDNVLYRQPVTLNWTVGSTHTLSTTTPQNTNGCRTEAFASWTDGGAISHTVTALAGTTAYQANFSVVPSTPSVCTLTTAANPASGGTVTPATASYSYGTYVPLTATPKTGYVFANWTGPVADPASASTYIRAYGGQAVTANFYKPTTQRKYVVNSLLDDPGGNPAGCATTSGACTLRDALVGAADAGSGTIIFSPTVFAASQPASARTINLIAALVIPPNTTITGPTTGSGATLAQLVTITPSNDTAFEVDKGTSGVSISGLSISGGSFPYGVAYAEAVRNLGGVLTISNTLISGNSIGFDGNSSGAVYNGPNGTLTLTNCNISSNTSYLGFSGIGNDGTLVVTGSIIAGNTTQDANGAGILNSGTATLTDTTVSGNQIFVHNDGGRGGGIYNSGTLTLVNSSVTGNGATNPGDGSGIYTTGTLHVTNTKIVSNLTNYDRTYDNGSFPPVEDDCDGPGCPAQPIPAPPTFNPPSGSYLNVNLNVTLSDTTPGSVFFYTLDGSTPTLKSPLTDSTEPLPFGGAGVGTVKVIALANGEVSPVATAVYNGVPSTCTVIDYSAGFTPSNLTLNGGATVTHNNLLQLTDGHPNQARSAFYSTPVPVNEFTADFQFQILYPLADGITFTIQSAGPDALGQPGGGLGYAGIPKSVALKFDLFNNGGEGFDSTGYYLDGSYPSAPALDLSQYGIYLHSGHVFAAHITFAGGVITGTITDLTTYQSYTAKVTGDLTKVVGQTAYVGFTGGTGLLTAIENILTWTYAGGPGCGSSASAASR